MTDLIDLHLTALRAEGQSLETIAHREAVLWRLERDLPRGLDEANQEELQAWLGRDKWTVKTKETYWCHIVAFYRWCRAGRAPRMDWDPSEDIPRPRPPAGLPHPATDAQLARALDELRHPLRRAVVLAGGAGMRASEIANATSNDVTRKGIRIVGKGGKLRFVPINADVWDEVRDVDGPLILSQWGPVTGRWLSNRCSAVFSRMGLHTTLHSFRHLYATRLRRAGVDMLTISKLLGHSSVSTTQIYTLCDETDLEAAVARLPALFNADGPAS